MGAWVYVTAAVFIAVWLFVGVRLAILTVQERRRAVPVERKRWDYTVTLWVCQCCMLIHANGECCVSDEHGGDSREPLSLIGEDDGLALGMGYEFHAETCTEEVRESDGCDCERDTFSWTSCDGCGSWLAGERHAMTLFVNEWKYATAGVAA